jgi:hypothetical protein
VEAAKELDVTERVTSNKRIIFTVPALWTGFLLSCPWVVYLPELWGSYIPHYGISLFL